MTEGTRDDGFLDPGKRVRYDAPLSDRMSRGVQMVGPSNESEGTSSSGTGRIAPEYIEQARSTFPSNPQVVKQIQKAITRAAEKSSSDGDGDSVIVVGSTGSARKRKSAQLRSPGVQVPRTKSPVYQFVHFLPQPHGVNFNKAKVPYICKVCGVRKDKGFHTTKFLDHLMVKCEGRKSLDPKVRQRLLHYKEGTAVNVAKDGNYVRAISISDNSSGASPNEGGKIESGNKSVPSSAKESSERFVSAKKKGGPSKEDNQSEGRKSRRSSQGKEQRTASMTTTKKTASGDFCSTEMARKGIATAIEYMILENQPFNMFESKPGKGQSRLTKLLSLVKPSFRRYLPGAQLLGGRYLNLYYQRVRSIVKERIKTALDRGYGTIVFDGWEDNNKCSVVNVLLKTTTTSSTGTQVFFLKSLYVKDQSMTGDKYQSEVEKVMEEYGGHSRICAVTSDNTSACVKARRLYAEKFKGVVSCNDQCHAIDLLIKAVCELDWIEEVLTAVGEIANAISSHAKLKSR